MRNIMAVAGKELRAYFHSPIAYLVLAIYSILCGFFFYSITATFVVESFRMQMGGGGMPPINLNEMIIRQLFQGILTVILALFLMPVVTMRLYAEEKRTGTMELLLTSPVTDLEIIVGKLLGAMGLYMVIVLLTFLDIGLLFLYGNPDPKPLVANAIGYILFGGALMALGMWVSSFTKNQIIAAVVAAALFLILYVLDWVSSFSSTAVGKVMSYLALPTHFENFTKGVIDSSDLIYFISVIVVGIFLTARSVEAMKGRP
ncbi:MAG TPA: ABC transporter permease subunit [Terriglobia bacterium]|jgi:ABC-2 type transport system permease protein|nr:ABC transporter permease subunit [Terriglobia bacterium]